MTQGQVTKTKELAAAGDIVMAGQTHPGKRSTPTCGQASCSGKALSGDSCCHLAAVDDARLSAHKTGMCAAPANSPLAGGVCPVPEQGRGRRYSGLGELKEILFILILALSLPEREPEFRGFQRPQSIHTSTS